MKKLIVFGLLLVLILILLLNTFTNDVENINVDRIVPLEIEEAAIERMAQAIRFPTISYDEPGLSDTSAFIQFRDFLEQSFPMVHTNLEKEVIEGNSLLFRWRGTDESLLPVIFLGHMDVVPVEEASADLWDEAPFAGTVKDGFIWGRGALDDKNGVVGILEAVEMLLREGFQPQADIYLAFGHDEEAAGRGAIAMASLLKSRNIKASFILDEGGIVADGIVPGVQNFVALIGTAEKGYTSLNLTVNIEGGHSSMPAKETSIEVISRAIVNLRENPFPAQFTEPVRGLLKNISPHMPFFQRMVLSNLWLFKPAVIRNYEQTPSGNATVRTTIAPTIIRSGVKENLVPVEANAVVNFRTLPGQTSDEVVEYVRKTIDDDRVQITRSQKPQEPSRVSESDNVQFNTLRISAKQIFGDIIVSPYLGITVTDARHYPEVSDNIYRFSPMIMTSEDLKRIHGVNEKISIENYKDGIRFYYQVIKNLNTMK